MKKQLLTFIAFILFNSIHAQLLLKPADLSDTGIPQWARMMYDKNPNVYAVEAAYEAYYAHHAKDENRHTAYYHHWRRYMQPYVQDDGSIQIPTLAERNLKKARSTAAKNTAAKSLSPWTFAGPEKNFRRRNNSTDTVVQISWHANMYCIDQSISNPNTLYAGSENGGVYKSIDKGLSWQYISAGEDMTTVSAISVNPSDENDVLVNTDNETYHSTDGGVTWGISNPQLQNVQVWQFLYNPANTQMVYASTQSGLYRSTDGGNNWALIFPEECQSVAINPGNAGTVYALRYNSTTRIAECNKSLDSGLTFVPKTTGWFTVPIFDTGKLTSYGGRIAVTEADTGRVYVLLVGESQSTAQLQLHGQIGVYRSDDGGETWSNPHGLIGAPYNSSTHPNMMTFSGGNDTYNQIYYNTSLVASQLDADKILIGGMSLWRSNDGAAVFQPVGGYIGSVPYIHPDNQEIKIYKTSMTSQEVWIACDGGINYSTDFFVTHQSLSNGLYGAAYWGFDQGWNDDIMVGGRYHNGNAARRDGYPQGEYQQLGGGEAATGYVNYSNEKKTYYSDIGGVILPDTLNGLSKSFPVSEDPNESYVDNSSSRIMFDWDYWNVAYLGKENKIYKSTNGGSSYGVLHAFGTATGDKVLWMEQSRASTNVIYAQQVVNNISKIWKSTDRGLTWSLIPLPQNKRELNFTLSYNNADELWISYPKGSNGSKIYHTINSGTSWNNMTTAILNGFEIESMCHQFGTDGGVYLGTYHGPVFYRNNNIADWNAVGTNIPYISYPLRLVPFYRDNKLKLATWHLGIWETALYESSQLVADFSADYRSYYCPGDTISFVPHCVASANATYQWTFTGANPATSTDMYPKVVYTATGSNDVKLVVTDGIYVDSITKPAFITTVPGGILPLQEGFESGTFNANWQLYGTGTTASNWNINTNVGGFGQSTYCMQNDNFNFDAQGAHDAIYTEKYDFTSAGGTQLIFDVAYAPYGGIYSDTLEVLASTDCGATFTSLYLKGGNDLATAPAITASAFIPAAAEWRTDSIDVSAYAGNSEVLFAFVNIGNFGQVLYVDNINLYNQFTSLNDLENNFSFSVYPNPVRDELNVICTGLTAEKNIQLKISNVAGQEIIRKEIQNPLSNFKLVTADLISGIYLLEISARGKKAIAKFTKQ